MPVTSESSRKSIPIARVCSMSRSTTSLSALRSGRDRPSTIATDPARIAIWENSREMNPAPIKTMRLGNEFSSRNSVLDMTWPSPGIESGRGLAPVATTTCLARKWFAPMESISGEVNRASPWSVRIPASSKAISRFGGTGSVNDLLKRISSGQSSFAAPSRPWPTILLCHESRSAAPTRTFLGSQPRTAQVPPYG